LLYEYDLDTGSGFTGVYKEITAASLGTEVISATGFRPRVRITAQTEDNNILRGLAILTNTTLAAQAANLYPLATYTLTVENIVAGSDVVIYPSGTETVLRSIDSVPATTWNYVYTTPTTIDIGVFRAGYIPLYIRGLVLTTAAASVQVAQAIDRAYLD
jgi:hypothetical protein